MRKILKISVQVFFVFLLGCQNNLLDTDIEPSNINAPSINSLNNKEGLTTFAKGIYNFIASDDVFEAEGDEKESPMLFYTYGYHEAMGDVLVIPWGNFGSRWVNQTESITLDNGTLVIPPAGGAQPEELAARNTRAAGSNNALQYEWRDMYSLIVQSNTIIEALDNLTADNETLLAFNAWALWWKAYAYHRLGSLYEQGPIVEKGLFTNPTSEPNPVFLPREELISKSNQLLKELETLLNTVSDDFVFNRQFNNFQLAYLTASVDKTGLIENINTLKVRNLVYNTKVTEMSTNDWNAVISLANEGVSSNLSAFTMQSETSFIDNEWLPGRIGALWYLPSERLIQDINMEDNRLEYFVPGFIFPNPRGRGIQYGVTHAWNDNTAIVSQVPLEVTMYYAGSFEENQLFLAEAKVRINQIESGLAHLDMVREFQNSGLSATVGKGFSKDQALEEIRKERRLALILRAVAFYDARRYGIASGSRTGAHVLDENAILNTNATINYGYLEYWPVPAFEADYNPPSSEQL
jgi:hypothetical protein